jgi:predicted 3-demethylubiquinone-9 3-methyltransferase (glyoxalase superfamily)
MTIKSITPFLWFDDNAGDAADYYVALFPNSRILQTSRYGDFMPDKKGQIMLVELELMGQRLTFMNGGKHYKLDAAFSLSVGVEDQATLDKLWDALNHTPSACGWTTDKFGLVWQINYSEIPALMKGPNFSKVMGAMMKMIKIDIQALKDAAA